MVPYRTLHRFCVQRCGFGRALHSAPKVYIGQYLDVRADSALVKLFHNGQLVKVHPRQRPGPVAPGSSSLKFRGFLLDLDTCG
jgi:hypothetical protein